jgi:hypothetical protein
MHNTICIHMYISMLALWKRRKQTKHQYLLFISRKQLDGKWENAISYTCSTLHQLNRTICMKIQNTRLIYSDSLFILDNVVGNQFVWINKAIQYSLFSKLLAHGSSYRLCGTVLINIRWKVYIELMQVQNWYFITKTNTSSNLLFLESRNTLASTCCWQLTLLVKFLYHFIIHFTEVSMYMPYSVYSWYFFLWERKNWDI